MLQQEPAPATKASERQNVAAPTPPAPNLPARRFPDEEQFEEQRRGRRWTWIAILATPFLLLLGYYGMLWGARGDYLHDGLAPFSAKRLFLDPRPRFARGNGGDFDGYYWIDVDGIVALMKPENPLGKEYAWSHRALLSGVGGGYYRESYPGEGYGLPGQGQAYERFPPGCLGDFFAAGKNRNLQAALKSAAKIAADFPSRTTPKYWVAALTARAGELDEARRLLELWRPDFEADPSFRGQQYVDALESDLIAWSPEQVRKRAEFDTHFPRQVYVPKALGSSPPAFASESLEEFFAWIGDVDVYDPPVEPSMNFGEGHDFRARLDLLDALVRRGLFLAVDGRREEGACLVEKAWRLYGGRSGGMRATWRTAATYQIACLEALEPLVLNASLSIQELEVAWAMLERMARANPWSGPEELLRAMDPEFSGAFPKAQYLASLSDTDGRPSWIADAQAHDARLQIIREGLRVRHYQIVHGEWPSIGPDGAILGLELATEHAPILDPCADPPRPLRAELIDGGFRIKSFGPDEVDDGGAKNLGSARTDNLLGDVFIDLSESPLYDFPSDAGHAYADKAEFLRRYPEGFPRQAFSTYERAPARHENGSPMMELHYDRAADRLMVWSPDTLGRIRRWAGSKGLFSSGGPGTLYDPRAGFGSRGDYAMQLNILDPSDF